MELKYSVVDRGGFTANQWSGSTQTIAASTSPKGDISIRFLLPSKGGGKTDILVTLDVRDIRRLLKQLATESPKMARVFAECTHISLKSLPSLGFPQGDDV